MTKEQINREMAEKCMGWEPLSGAWGEHGWYKDKEGNYKMHGWNPAERIDHAWMVEEVIGERLLMVEYIHALIPLLLTTYQLEELDWRTTEGWELFIYRFMHATAEQRCLAALEAVKEGK